MSYLSMTNVFMKTQHRFLQDSPVTTTTPPPPPTTNNLLFTSNNNQLLDNKEKLEQVWSNYNFDPNNVDNNLNNNNKLKMSWTINCNNNNNNNNNNEIKRIQKIENDTKTTSSMNKEATVDEKIPPQQQQPSSPPASTTIINEEKDESSSPSHHARRPPNAFLIFCKKHRPIVRSKYPSLENRGVTKILGEWWALLDDNDKAPYTQLAKEYKDAFLSANPDFKWYKLPAPPLRTLNIRPNNNNNSSGNVHKVPSPILSPSLGNLQIESEFTPGKLADESQLGNLTALMNNNHSNNNNNYATTTPTSSIINENNNNIDKSPVNLIRTHLPPSTPIKKRISQKYLDHRNITRNLMENISGGEQLCNNNNDIQTECEHNDHDNFDDNNEINDNSNNMTNQELMNKVVDKLFTTNNDYDNNNNNDDHHRRIKHSKEIRKSGRQCKGKRYEKFMSEGRLLGNKRDNNTKISNRNNNNNNDYDEKFDNELNLKLETTKTETETPNLDHTIKRLAERTNMKSLLTDHSKTNQINDTANDNPENNNDINTNNNNNNTTTPPTTKTANDFNLDLKISLLPSLSYDVYSQRKKDSKKRKTRIRPNTNNNNNNNNNDDDNPNDAKIPKIVKNDQPVGSKKRKNKNSITHLENKQLQQQQQDNNCNDSINNDLLGLATLAEVAANTQKIKEEISQ